MLKDPGFAEAIESPQFDLTGSIGEALDAIHSPTGNVKMMAEDSCLVIAVIVQWLVRYVTKRLMHLLTPEALIVNAQQIPRPFMKAYFEFQKHFSLKNLIKNHQAKRKRYETIVVNFIIEYTCI